MGLFVLAALLSHEPPPSASRILTLQEAQARLQSRSAMADQPMKPKPAAVDRMISPEERKELQQALERFVREHAGQVVDLR